MTAWVVTWKDRRVSWRTVPTFAAGALATAAGAVLVWCRGAAQAWAARVQSPVRPEPLPLNAHQVPDKAG